MPTCRLWGTRWGAQVFLALTRLPAKMADKCLASAEQQVPSLHDCVSPGRALWGSGQFGPLATQRIALHSTVTPVIHAMSNDLIQGPSSVQMFVNS